MVWEVQVYITINSMWLDASVFSETMFFFTVQICTDIAATSIDQCRDRYSSLKRKAKNRRVFDVEFIVVDLGRVRL